MSKWFYCAWALVVALAIILPVAIPFWVWSAPGTGPGTWRGPADGEMFGHWARTQVEGTRFIPSSVEVEAGPELSTPVPCVGPSAMDRLPRLYTAEVTLRGAYGLPLESYKVTCSGWSHVGDGELGGLGIQLAAILGGVVVVSIPFFPLWLRHKMRKRLQPAR